jgi:hypothetical protein
MKWLQKKNIQTCIAPIATLEAARTTNVAIGARGEINAYIWMGKLPKQNKTIGSRCKWIRISSEGEERKPVCM